MFADAGGGGPADLPRILETGWTPLKASGHEAASPKPKASNPKPGYLVRFDTCPDEALVSPKKSADLGLYGSSVRAGFGRTSLIETRSNVDPDPNTKALKEREISNQWYTSLRTFI